VSLSASIKKRLDKIFQEQEGIINFLLLHSISIMRAAFFDVDGTLTTTRVWQGLMDYFRVHKTRRGTHLFFWTFHFPLYLLRRMKLISEGAFRTPWAAHLAWYFRGYSMDGAEKVWKWVVENGLEGTWRTDTCKLLKDHLENGDLVVLVSGAPLPLLQQIGLHLGTSHVVGTILEVIDGHYTGRSLKPVCIDENKASLTKAYLNRKGFEVDFDKSFAYADSTSDLSMLEMVGNPIATYPEQDLRVIALERNWSIFPDVE
jgi:HAD superfamily hydrolase (TIGR01490 family)